MDDRLKGWAAGIFFIGYISLQVPGGYWSRRWGARRTISLFLVAWGLCAAGCGLAQSFTQFAIARFLLGVAESGVFPATLVLLANWFPRAERARANAFWNLCQPLAVVASAPLTSALLGAYGWRPTLVLEGMLPFLWLPIWWFGIRDHPRDAKWISDEERDFVETTLRSEIAELESPTAASRWAQVFRPSLAVMIVIYFLHNCAAYGCMTFFTDTLKDKGFSHAQYGLLFAVPYAFTAIVMVVNSWHSDKTLERKGHVAAVYFISGASLVLSVLYKQHFWLSYALLCLAIPGPFAAMAPFWAIPGEAWPRWAMGLVMGLVNAFGNLGGFVGTTVVGQLKQTHGNLELAFGALGAGMLLAACLSFLLPTARKQMFPIQPVRA
jgi:MFS family permease